MSLDRSRPPSVRGRTVRRAALALLALAGTLAALEAALRVRTFAHERAALRRAAPLEDYWAVPDDELGYRLNPEFGDHNAQGLRDDPVGPKAGRFRVVVLGDSVGYYGEEPADTWVGYLEARLADRGGPEIDVVNACVRGYTTEQELAWLERDGLALEPDLVVLGFVLNDLHPVLHGFRVRDGRILDAEPYAFVHGPRRGLDRSQLWRWVRWRLQRGVRAADADDPAALARPFDTGPAWHDGRWPATRRRLGRLAALGRRESFAVHVIVFPLEQQYRPDLLERDAQLVRKPQRELARACAELGLPLLDLYEHLDPTEHFLPDGLHLSGPGRAHVGALVADALAAGGHVPGP